MKYLVLLVLALSGCTIKVDTGSPNVTVDKVELTACFEITPIGQVQYLDCPDAGDAGAE